VDGSHIIIYCVPEEVKQFHLRDIKEDVATTNQKYREYLHREEVRKAQQITKEEMERDALDNALDGLDI